MKEILLYNIEGNIAAWGQVPKLQIKDSKIINTETCLVTNRGIMPS